MTLVLMYNLQSAIDRQTTIGLYVIQMTLNDTGHRQREIL